MSKQITLSKIKQLIDINENLVNFEINFKITTKNNEPFEMVVVDQNTLNNNPNLEYKKVNGSISGTIRNDNNIFQTHFLVLRADNPCECLIMFDKKEIMPEMKILENETSNTEPSFVKKYFSYILISIGICVAIWYFFFRNKNNQDVVSDKLQLCDLENKEACLNLGLQKTEKIEPPLSRGLMSFPSSSQKRQNEPLIETKKPENLIDSNTNLNSEIRKQSLRLPSSLSQLNEQSRRRVQMGSNTQTIPSIKPVNSISGSNSKQPPLPIKQNPLLQKLQSIPV